MPTNGAGVVSQSGGVALVKTARAAPTFKTQVWVRLRLRLFRIAARLAQHAGPGVCTYPPTRRGRRCWPP
ncbi:MAG: hypothetical protein JWO57_2133 [Pseudonocardiales bacterium]|nr:hypothetical protein [Pseudonocardiales bacterium]